MLYKLYQLKFLTPVHFGSEKRGTSLENANIMCHSDTLFSAICNEYVKLYDELELDDYKELFEDGKILISSMFPYKGSDLFVPKPSIMVERKNVNEEESARAYKNKKKMKKLEFISVCDFQNYINCIKTGEQFTYDEEDYEIAKYSDNAKVSLRTNEDENKLYHVGTYTFKEDAGLYFIAAFEEESYAEQFENILTSLQYSGIGGKRTSGYGKFEYDDIELNGNLLPSEQALLDLLKAEGRYRMALSVVSPDENEIETDFSNSFYNLIKRDGFIYSVDYAETLVKRKNLVMFKEGSCFDIPIKGTIQDVSDNGKHSIYRYGKAITIGVEV